ALARSPRHPHRDHRPGERAHPRRERGPRGRLPRRSVRGDRAPGRAPAGRGARAAARHAGLGHHPARAADDDGHQPRARRPRRLAAPRRAARRGVRLHGAARSVLGPHGDPLHRRRDAGLQVPALEHAQGARPLLHDAPLRLPRGPDGRARLPAHAGQAALRARRGARAAQGDGAGEPQRRAGRGARHHGRAALRARVAGARPPQARVRRGGDHGRPVGRARGGGRRLARGVPARGALAQRARRGGTLLHLPRARQAVHVGGARHALQRPLPLARPRGARDRGGARGGAAPHHDARLLARGRPRVRAGQHHGRGARHREGGRARPQGRDRRAPRRGGHPGALHQRVLGRAQRDQAVGDLAHRVRPLVRRHGARPGGDAGM
ncbi:MAG: Siroheme decarboxylase AhbA, alternate heme biosynthesis pathway / Siroheme decarboxylase AhbB, alternate heme biosynthesis pathway, partial [uncultured Gemmatimonadaceae bacterium]